MSYLGNIPSVNFVNDAPNVTYQVAGTGNDGTNYSVVGGYTIGFLEVYQNGVRLIPTVDYTANNGADVVLAVDATNGDEIMFEAGEATVNERVVADTLNGGSANQIPYQVSAGVTAFSNTKTINGSSILGSGNIPIAPTTVIVSSTPQAATANNHYVITNGTATTVNLPNSPADGDIIWITVTNGLTTNVIGRGGKEIEGVAEDMTIDHQYVTVQLKYIDSTRMWRIL